MSAAARHLAEHGECATLTGLAAFVAGRGSARHPARRLAAGEVLFWAGEESDHRNVVCLGEVESRLMSDSGRELQVAGARAGDAVGETCLCAARLRPATAALVTQAQTQAQVAPVFAEDVMAYVQVGPNRAFEVLGHLFHWVGDLTRRLEALACASARARLMGRLLELAAGQTVPGSGPVLVAPPRHEDRAGEIFATREEATSILADLRRAGATAYQGQPSAIVVSPDRLRRSA